MPDLLLVLARKFRSATKGFEVSVVQKIGKISEMDFFVYFVDAVYPAHVWHSAGTSQDLFRNVRLCFQKSRKYYSRLALIPHLFEIGDHMP